MLLPEFLKDRYKDWINNVFPDSREIYKSASSKIQKPKAMIISCCDSRVHSAHIFKSQIGEIFEHKNIANLVPSLELDKYQYGTISAIDYATKILKIPNIIILGHSDCGGIKHAYEIFSKEKPIENSNIDKWINIVKPAFEILDKKLSKEDCLRSLEKLSIKNSIENLNKFPDINEMLRKNKINIYGLWFEIASGKLMSFDRKKNNFENIS